MQLIKITGSRRGFMESRRLMWAYAKQAKVSYFHLLCRERVLYALYDEDVFCGCAVCGSPEDSVSVLCLFPATVRRVQEIRGPVTELLAAALGAEPVSADFVLVAEPFRPSALRQA